MDPRADLRPLKKGEVNLGTSIMAIKFKDGIILGADSRTSMGSMIANRVTDKLTQIHDKVWCCRSGSAADTQSVSDYVKFFLDQCTYDFGQKPTARIAANLFRELCYRNKAQLTAGIILAGYDEETGGEVYSIPLGGSLHKADYAIAGSGSTYIYGLCNKYYKPDMEREEAIEFVKQSLTQAIRWDGSSGGVIRMVLLTKNDPERLLFLPDEYRADEYPSQTPVSA
ncbi:Proteasome subunit beta type-1 [Wickerhamiella sorbophila]|uniref:Proteasome subunit beta n=1 Tax=Wickerhamiella sorbophila TaxID=45607 RepID=A0A2T0FEX0_9ASCO|nr:Proteasome subunit beta type-1 [Wickerhamiella sorbophila]PRT53542.1 Proteasome subunit beta type-1 [Wickerhamiella sorbophila]